ncbi:MAG: stage III sporulation protein AG [Firmicutes bacterium]|mgnify:CR=1 FL=1|uniref:Stage III sporulation protein AG n=1 Tax=Melghirimyces thermohalophilus TaxID=1236220 RepID=A0A1G6Q8Y9_9BACL|nr:stage III sporulation protein AG [Melghirimyces thermohalophilus]MDA8354313.1 stage III sporulation protein AG [Bacillota bacterium]SDC88783.1 stage III sporulation protein AG [Melghirimyces thermohalophilus]
MLKRFLDRLEQSLGGGGNSPGKGNTFRWLIVIGCFGVALMILSSFFSVRQEAVPPQEEASDEKSQDSSVPAWKKDRGDKMSIEEYEDMYESQLSEVLASIVGVEDVSVMVNLESSAESVYVKDQKQSEQATDEQDKQGGTRKIEEETTDEKVVLRRKGDGEEPIVVKKVKPQIRGVLVVAKGAEDLQVKAAMIESIQRLLDVPVHRISVMPRG